jgi:MEMO1 family protein
MPYNDAMNLHELIRAPAVAGYFYPSDPAELHKTVEAHVRAGRREEPLPAKAVIVPHAGYVYSGKTAGIVYGGVALPCRILILGPNHTGLGTSLSVFPSGVWTTPLGRVAVDGGLAVAVAAACPGAKLDTVAHMREHAVEVQLPFLQFALPDFRFAAITVGTHEYARLERLGEAVAEAIHESQEPVMLVVSSDMTHYEDAESARRKDGHAIEAMAAIEPRELHRAVQREGISMCGFAPAVAALAALRALGAKRGELMDYSNSGDTTGDYRSLVAYAGMRFS